MYFLHTFIKCTYKILKHVFFTRIISLQKITDNWSANVSYLYNIKKHIDECKYL